MKFVKADYTPYRVQKRIGELESLIMDFADSGLACAEVLDWESGYVSSRSCSATLCSKIKRLGCTHIRVSESEKLHKVWLINTLVKEES